MKTSNIRKLFSLSRSVILISTSIVIILSLISYKSTDISFNTFSNQPLSNILGSLGSYLSDILIQGFGFSSFLIAPFILLYNKAKHYLYITSGGKQYSIGALFLLIFTSSTLEKIQPLFASNYHYGGLVGKFTGELPLYFQILILFLSITSIVGLQTIKKIRISPKEFALSLFQKKITKPFQPTHTESKESQQNNLFSKKTTIKKETFNSKIKQEKITHNKPEKIEAQPNQFIDTKQNSSFLDTSLLLDPRPPSPLNSISETNATLQKLESVLKEFGISGKIISTQIGPVVTLYELEPSAGTKSARVIGLADDIARSMSATSVRISVIPGRNAMGIELPNQDREILSLKEIIESKHYQNQEMILPIALGKTINGTPFIVDLAKMPHLLVAGTTGSGKSVAINAMILSLLYKRNADQCKMIMIDPKMLELSVYDGIPNLLCPVVIDPKKASAALKWVTREMETRYKTMSKIGVRNIEGYNKKVQEHINQGKTLERKLQTGFDPATGQPIFETETIESKIFQYIVVIVDEMADLMLVAGKEIEASVQRLAQMARAAGIHIIMATQRPSVDVITGVIKANFPTRISFAVTSKIDSRTILGEQGAEQLLGNGDMLYMAAGGKVTRVHGPLVEDEEVRAVTEYLQKLGKPIYIENITNVSDEESNKDAEQTADTENKTQEDPLYKKAIEIVFTTKKTSTSYVQRQLRIGYNRAANLIERMEQEGLISEPNHSGKREIIRQE